MHALEENSSIHRDDGQNETMMQPQTRPVISGRGGTARRHSQEGKNRSVSFQDRDGESEDVFAESQQLQPSEGRMSTLNYNEKQLRDLPDFDHALIQYHKQVEQERIEGNDM